MLLSFFFPVIVPNLSFICKTTFPILWFFSRSSAAAVLGEAQRKVDFRLPPHKWFGLPGLIDDNESPEAAALRELEEETGYKGDVAECSPGLYCFPGLHLGQTIIQAVDSSVYKRIDSLGVLYGRIQITFIAANSLKRNHN